MFADVFSIIFITVTVTWIFSIRGYSLARGQQSIPATTASAIYALDPFRGV